MNTRIWLAAAMPILVMAGSACGAADPGSADSSGTASQNETITTSPVTGELVPAGTCAASPGGPCETIRKVRAIGDKCAFDAECSTGFCALGPGMRCGACTAALRPGDSCVLHQCGAGLACNAQDRCEPGAKPGQFCTPDNPCAAGMSCARPILRPLSGAPASETAASADPSAPGPRAAEMLPAGGETQPAVDLPRVATAADALLIRGAAPELGGVCQPNGRQVGAPCDPAGVDAPRCDADSGLYCNGLTKQCEQLKVVGVGASCGTINGQLRECGSGSVCMSLGPMTPKTCVSIQVKRTRCDPMARNACGRGERCVTRDLGNAEGRCERISSAMCR